MPKSGQDTAGMIIDFLQLNNGKAIINQAKDVAKFHCCPSGLRYSLGRLIDAGIVKTSIPIRQGSHKPVEFMLSDEFRSGDGWRETLKRGFSGGESGASPGVTAGLPKQPTPAKAHTDDECLQYRITLSRDLVEVYKRLEEAQGRIVRLQDEIKAKDKKIEDLTGEIETEAVARKKEVDELAVLDLQLRELRGRTSISKKVVRLDNNGVMIVKGEGLPDRA